MCLEENIEFIDHDANGFAQYRFEHDAIPEINFDDIDTSTIVFGKKLNAPIIIGAMTGGSDQALEINKRLAHAAEKCGVGFALGSQRAMIEDPSLINTYDARKWAPELRLLIGNIGAVQLNYGTTAQQISALINTIHCDAINFHFNPLQEVIQPEGDRNFGNLSVKLTEIISTLTVPAIAKEVGCGISEKTAEKFSVIGFSAIETAGLGGTSWSQIESHRTSALKPKKLGETFARWGVPTAESILNCKKYFKGKTIIASGGLRNGIEIAKSLALGADSAALALPLLKAASNSTDEAIHTLELLIEELKTTMFLTGSRTIDELKSRPLLRKMDYTGLK